MKYMLTFLGLFIVCMIAYMGLWMGVSAGQLTPLAYLMMPVGLGMGAFFILFLVKPFQEGVVDISAMLKCLE